MTDQPVVCVGEDATDAVGNGRTWPGGVRRMLIDTAAGIEFAPDPADSGTWFTGREAFPH